MTSSGAAPAENAVKPRKSQNTDDDLCAATLQHTVVARSIDKFGHLRRQESLQLRYAFLVLLRDGQLGSHLVKAVRKALKLIAGLDGNAVVEGPGADPLGSLLEHALSVRSSGAPVHRRATGEMVPPREALQSAIRLHRSVRRLQRAAVRPPPSNQDPRRSCDGSDVMAAHIPARREARPAGPIASRMVRNGLDVASPPRGGRG